MPYFVDDSDGVVPVDFFMDNADGVVLDYEEGIDDLTGEVIGDDFNLPDGSEVNKRPRRKYQGMRP